MRKYCRKITKLLYDDGGFVANYFNDPEMVAMYDELMKDEEWYKELFSFFSSELRFDHECYYLTRKLPKSQYETRLRNFYLWIDVIDLMTNIFVNCKPGMTYKFTEVLKLVETGSNLPQKLKNVCKTYLNDENKETNENLNNLFSFLVKSQVLDKIEKKDEENEFVVTAVYTYYSQCVYSIKLHQVEEQNNDNPTT